MRGVHLESDGAVAEGAEVHVVSVREVACTPTQVDVRAPVVEAVLGAARRQLRRQGRVFSEKFLV